jgi:hypothetical protein
MMLASVGREGAGSRQLQEALDVGVGIAALLPVALTASLPAVSGSCMPSCPACPLQLGRLPATLRSLKLVWKPADLPGRLCGVLPYLRELSSSSLRALELVRSSAWQPGGPSFTLRDCPAEVTALEELAATTGGLTISLSRH